MDIRTVQQNLANGVYENQMTTPFRGNLPITHIFDVEKSREWNQKAVEKENEYREQYRKDYNKETTRLYKLFDSDIIDALVDTHTISREKAEKMLSYVWVNFNREFPDMSIPEMLTYLDSVAKLINAVMDTK